MVRTDNDTVRELGSRPWSRVLVPDEGVIAASVPELPGCFAEGTTFEEALANLEDALELWLSSAVELGNEVPEPQRDVETPEYSGRFSVRVPRSLHRRLAVRAEGEACSLNQLVNNLLAEAVGHPGARVATSSTDASEDITADATAAGIHSIGALKGIGTFLRNRGDVNLACLAYSFAAERIAAGPDGAREAAKEFGTAGALAKRERRPRLAEALWRRSLRLDLTNIRSGSSLGQLLHHQGRYEEAIGFLEGVAEVDNYAKLFLGWSRLQLGLVEQDEEVLKAGLADLTVALRRWCAYASQAERAAWIRQVRRLRLLGPRFGDEVDQLVSFANSNANWARISVDEVTSSSAEDDDRDFDLESSTHSSEAAVSDTAT